MYRKEKIPEVLKQISGIFLCFCVFNIGFDRCKALGTDVVFHLAGITGGSLGGDTEGDQPVGNQGMTFIHGFGPETSGVGKGDIAGIRHIDQAALAQIFHGNTDTGLGIAELVYDVDGTDIRKLFTQHKDRFQIILNGLLGLVLLI